MATYWKRVRYGDHADPPWEVRAEAGRGLVAYATRDFSPGDLICVEFPTLWISGHHPFSEIQVREIMEKVAALEDEDRAAFFAMANVYDESDHPAAVGIFMTNCFDMTDSVYGTCCAMYLALARLNHSCVPNAQQTHIPATTEEVLYASRAIAKGTEINDCYIDLRQPRAARQEQLLEFYRFGCACAGCTLVHLGATSDTLEKLLERDDHARSAASQIIDDLTDIITEDALAPALRKAVGLAKDLAKKDVLPWSVRYLPELYLCIYEIALTCGERGTARKHLEKAHTLHLLLQGPASADSQRTEALLRKNAR